MTGNDAVCVACESGTYNHGGASWDMATCFDVPTGEGYELADATSVRCKKGQSWYGTPSYFSGEYAAGCFECSETLGCPTPSPTTSPSPSPTASPSPSPTPSPTTTAPTASPTLAPTPASLVVTSTFTIEADTKPSVEHMRSAIATAAGVLVEHVTNVMITDPNEAGSEAGGEARRLETGDTEHADDYATEVAPRRRRLRRLGTAFFVKARIDVGKGKGIADLADAEAHVKTAVETKLKAALVAITGDTSIGDPTGVSAVVAVAPATGQAVGGPVRPTASPTEESFGSWEKLMERPWLFVWAGGGAMLVVIAYLLCVARYATREGKALWRACLPWHCCWDFCCCRWPCQRKSPKANGLELPWVEPGADEAGQGNRRYSAPGLGNGIEDSLDRNPFTSGSFDGGGGGAPLQNPTMTRVTVPKKRRKKKKRRSKEEKAANPLMRKMVSEEKSATKVAKVAMTPPKKTKHRGKLGKPPPSPSRDEAAAARARGAAARAKEMQASRAHVHARAARSPSGGGDKHNARPASAPAPAPESPGHAAALAIAREKQLARRRSRKQEMDALRARVHKATAALERLDSEQERIGQLRQSLVSQQRSEDERLQKHQLDAQASIDVDVFDLDDDKDVSFNRLMKEARRATSSRGGNHGTSRAAAKPSTPPASGVATGGEGGSAYRDRQRSYSAKRSKKKNSGRGQQVGLY